MTMTIKRVWIEEGCIACGMSELYCPEIFKLDVDEATTTTVIDGVDFSKYDKEIREAAQGCPAGVIKFEES